MFYCRKMLSKIVGYLLVRSTADKRGLVIEGTFYILHFTHFTLLTLEARRLFLTVAINVIMIFNFSSYYPQPIYWSFYHEAMVFPFVELKTDIYILNTPVRL